jgi:hypothetical protein
MSKSQNDRILQYLRSGLRELTPMRAINLFRCMRLAARIADLKEQGAVIVSRMVTSDNGKRFAAYRMVRAPRLRRAA